MGDRSSSAVSEPQSPTIQRLGNSNEHKMFSDAKSASLGARICWVFVHIVALIFLFCDENDLSDAFKAANVAYWLCFLALIVCSAALYTLVNITSPGYVDSYQDLEMQPSSDGEDQQQHKYNRKCNICDVTMPIRAKHCRDCNRCILKFDHHCFWIGQCVGEFNHREFWWYLLVQTTVLIWTAVICISGYRSDSVLGTVLNSIVLIICIAFGCMTGGLLVFHSYLALTGQTTWEVMRHERIDYLAEVPIDVYPFNHGCFTNLRMFCLASKSRGRTDWPYPEPPFGEERKCWIFENQYYSCC